MSFRPRRPAVRSSSSSSSGATEDASAAIGLELESTLLDMVKELEGRQGAEHAMTGGPRHRTPTETSFPHIHRALTKTAPLTSSSPPAPGPTWYPRLAAGSLLVFFLVTCSTYLHSTPWQSRRGTIGSPRHDWPPDPVPPSSRPGSHSPPVLGCRDAAREAMFPRQKAALLLLARDSDLEALLPTLENFEARFNGKFAYPYVFLNDVPYSASFVVRVRAALEGREVEFGTIDKADWSVPDWVDEAEARDAFARMGREGVQYADRESYHHMCRYYSGLFANHPLLEKYDWYWRLEPGVRYYCDITYDPFRFLAERDMVYGFVITIVETPNTIPTLFRTMLEWRDKNMPSHNRSALWEFFIKPGQSQEEYNLCHFWTNMEIGSLGFFRSPAYRSLFDHLDRAGGFYLERWGDAPIRSLALGLLADFDKVHYFEDLAYKHDWFLHCPSSLPDDFPTSSPDVGCDCQCPARGSDGNTDIDRDWRYSCLPRWRQLDVAW